MSPEIRHTNNRSYDDANLQSDAMLDAIATLQATIRNVFWHLPRTNQLQRHGEKDVMETTIQNVGMRVPLKIWLPLEEIESAALQQLENAASHPEAAVAIAAMPDTHVGYGVSIGCVMPTVNAVLPNAVGVDIGCGMCAMNTGIRLDRERMDKTFWRSWAGQVSRDVPTGFTWHRSPQKLGDLDRKLRASSLQRLIREKAAVQLGTLGGGNHFLEAQVDDDGSIWLMVHSGSRNTGLRIANHYNGLAVTTTERRKLAVGKDLASLPLDDQLGQDYLHDMQWATDFALASRKQMLDRMFLALRNAIDRWDVGQEDTPEEEDLINIHHNFANLEEHDGQQVMVHRKGATSAFAGQLGIIPGSMGSNSYIVRGLGNEASLKSCSHGAGRRMGRNAARQAITEADFARSLEGTHSRPSIGYLDEAPGAYKDVEVVMGRQSDLVDIVHTLKPIITVKGDSKARED
jgi:tRNA-splicing ligase RtcB